MSDSKENPTPVNFTVDAALVRELGERLVGRPHIALAELIKNSYDADAHRVRIEFTGDQIEVADNGHGMTFDEFEKYWMRLGTPHKQKKKTSRKFGRRLTGSKGVGRLAAQFLGKSLDIRTVPASDNSRELSASIDWETIAAADELVNATVDVEAVVPPEGRYPCGSTFGDPSGVEVTVNDLRHKWTPDDFRQLAREIWWLQPPFDPNPRHPSDRPSHFEVVFKAPEHEEAVAKFDQQMNAFMDIWHARIHGELEVIGKDKGNVRIAIQFAGAESQKTLLELGGKGDRPEEVQPVDKASRNAEGRTSWANNEKVRGNEAHDDVKAVEEDVFAKPRLANLQFEMRIYHLKHRQPAGIPVQKARDYLSSKGGVHVYDMGFHLPYYGVEHDWLGIEQAHSHRRSKSQLLPEELQVSGGLTKLPTQSRILGVVHVDTASERELADKMEWNSHLSIQVSRDRLVDNYAYRQLTAILRWALDWYAMLETQRSVSIREGQDKPKASERVARVKELLERVRREVPTDLAEDLEAAVNDALRAVKTDEERRERSMALLGSLATAGMTSLAFEHEIQKSYDRLDRVVRHIQSIAEEVDNSTLKDSLAEIGGELHSWLGQARAMRSLFSPLLEREDRETVTEFRAAPLLRQVVDDLGVLLRDIPVEIDVDSNLRLPAGRFVEWNAIFQNVLTNAVNALLDEEEQQIRITSQRRGSCARILVQDTGAGVDLDSSDDLFEPFVRHSSISQARRQLGLGGTGLGLTIVQLIAGELQVSIDFEQPEAGWSTQFVVEWKE